ncbi:hypothetical protein [Lentzea sp. CA-135723]|uniref:hypothetical protein n=1 Tax=Lentzea sp. CA-135723 TaxID=3239950 RepID=UPI003D8FFD44
MPNVHDDPDTIVTHLLERSGVIREPVPGQVNFVHRTFQEYLAGAEAMNDGQVETLAAHADQDSWAETIVLACGHGQRTQVNELLTEILDRADREQLNSRKLRLLAATCLETARDLDPAVLDRVNRMIEEQLVPPRDEKEAASLATAGHRILRYLPQDLTDLPKEVAEATVHATRLVGSPEAMNQLALYARDPRSGVQFELQKAWIHFDPKRFAEEVLACAPLLAGTIDITAMRLLPHLTALQHLNKVRFSLPDHEVQHDLLFAPAIPKLQSLGASVAGEVSLSPLANCERLRELQLSGADRYVDMEQLPRHLASLWLSQHEPWDDLNFLRGHVLLIADLSQVAAACDLSNLSGIRLFGCRNWTDYRALASLPRVSVLKIVNMDAPVDLGELPELPEIDVLHVRSRFQIDLRALAGKSLHLELIRRQRHVGLDELGPGVTINWVG